MIFALAGLALLYWAIAVGGHWAIARHGRRWLNGPAEPKPSTPAVSLVKALSGSFPFLDGNLSTFFGQDYPDFEIGLAAREPSDSAVKVARRVAARFPVRHDFFFGGEGNAANPKIQNVLPAFRGARHDWIWMTDDNAAVEAGRLRSLMAQADDPKLGILSAILCARDGIGFWGQAEAMTVNTFYARGMIAAHFAGRPAPQGKLMLFRRSVVDKFGGLAAVGEYPDDDLRLGAEVRKLGLTVQLDHEPIVQRIGRITFSQYWDRHVRWALIHRGVAPLAFWIQPFFSSLTVGAIGTWGAAIWFPGQTTAFVLAHALSWFLGDLWLLRRLDPHLAAEGLALWLPRQFMVLLVWLRAAVGPRHLQWRQGRVFTLDKNGRMKPHKPRP